MIRPADDPTMRKLILELSAAKHAEAGMTVPNGKLVAAMEAIQDHATSAYVRGCNEWAETLLRTVAERLHALYPQYDGYWDDWRLAVVKRSATFKGGRTIMSGDVVLAKPTARKEEYDTEVKRSVFSPRMIFSSAASMADASLRMIGE